MINSKIPYIDHSQNYWVGCNKIAVGCRFCYAEEFMTRKPLWMDTWGDPKVTNRIKTKTWRDLSNKQRLAEAEGRKHLVLTMSEGDLFEDAAQVEEWRRDALDMMPFYNMLIHLCLTKRPWNIANTVPAEWFTDGRWPANVMIGTSVSIQEEVDPFLGTLMSITPPPLHFVSVAPMLGRIDLSAYLEPMSFAPSVGWVLIEGESGKNNRPVDLDHIRYLLAQCNEYEVPAYVKQLGGYPNPKMDPDEWPEDLRVREYPMIFGKNFGERKLEYERSLEVSDG